MKKLLSLALCMALLLAAAAVVPANAESSKFIITAIADDPQQMDPTLNSYSRSSMVLQNLFVGLYKLGPDAETMVPAMAESYTVSEDGLTYTFKIREGLKWSDGSDLTAYDFEYSWLRVLDPNVGSKATSDLWIMKNGEAYYHGEVGVEEVGVKAEDEHTLVITLANPTPWFIKLTATTSFLPVCKANVEANEKWTSSVDTYVSNGPFMLTEYASLDHLTMVRNPNYYEADNVQIDGVRFDIIPDASTELVAYNNGDINVSTNVNADGINQYSGSAEFRVTPRIGIQYCDFNTQLPEFSDKRVRQAFAMSISRADLLKVMGVVEKPVYGFVPYAQPSLTDSTKSYRDIAGDMFVEDVDAAKALLAEAGYPNGEGFPKITIVVQSNNQQRLLAQYLGATWKQNLGIDYDIVTMESGYWDRLDEGNFSVDRNGYTCDYNDPSANLKIWTTGSNAYENGWDDPVYDGMFAATLSMLDDGEREAALIECEKYLVDQMPGMPIYSMESQMLVKPTISGVIANRIGHVLYEYAVIGD